MIKNLKIDSMGKYQVTLETVRDSRSGETWTECIYQKGRSSSDLPLEVIVDVLFWLGEDRKGGVTPPDGLYRYRSNKNVLRVRTGMSGCKDLTCLENLGTDENPFLNEQSHLHISCAGKIQPGVVIPIELLKYTGVGDPCQYCYKEFSYPTLQDLPVELERFEATGPACVAGEEE